jgi:hypothetical protein
MVPCQSNPVYSSTPTCLTNAIQTSQYSSLYKAELCLKPVKREVGKEGIDMQASNKPLALIVGGSSGIGKQTGKRGFTCNCRRSNIH